MADSAASGIPYLELKQLNHELFLTSIPARRLALIAYAAVRGVDDENGAVQRLLNQERISSIREFTQEVGDFPSSLVLNWTSTNNPLVRREGQLYFYDTKHSAQLIDGQHRLAGIRAAIADNPAIGELELPVAIYNQLDTKECADIFLSINTEQKPVPRSLVFDLYGIASDKLVDPAAVRARDIATYLNESETSPYYNQIKFPGSIRRKGGIALSTSVSAIKILVEEKGALEQIGIDNLETQKTIFENFFVALQQSTDGHWDDASNAFLYASGFIGALDFFRAKIVPYCNSKRSFKVDLIRNSLALSASNRLMQEEVKGLGGKDAPKRIFDRLVEAFQPQEADHTGFAL
jgi:DGQHR domain-containing protein